MISKVGAGDISYLQHAKKTGGDKRAAPVKENRGLDKVDTIKEQIKNGEYELDTQKTVQAIVKEII